MRLICSNCKGEMKFDAKTDRYKCSKCGKERKLRENIKIITKSLDEQNAQTT